MFGITLRFFLSIIVFLGFTCSVFSQTDTVFTNTSHLKDDSVKIKRLYNAALKYANFKRELCFPIADSCEKIGKRANWPMGTVNADHLRGLFYQREGQLDSALKYFFISLNGAKRIKRPKTVAMRYQNIAIVYKSMGKFKESLDNFLSAAKTAEEAKIKTTEAYAYIGMGEVFREQQNKEKAVFYYKKALDICIAEKDKKGTAACYLNLGITTDKKDPKQSLEYYTKAQNIYKEIDDLESVAHAYNLMAGCYNKFNDHKKAIECNELGLKMYKEIDNPKGIAESLCNMGENYQLIYKDSKNRNDQIKAADYLKQSLAYAEKIGHTTLKLHCNLMLAQANDKLKRYEDAYSYLWEYTGLKDTIFGRESAKQVAEMETKYQTEKKELEIKNLNGEKALQKTEIEKQEAEVKRQNTQKIAFAGGFILMLSLAFVAYRGYSQKKKDNKVISEQKAEVEAKNHQIELQKNIIEEEHREITDSINYAQRIQRAILKSEEYESKHLPEHFVLFLPKNIVSGDFYWVLEKGNYLYLTAADCTGHGVPGAFLTMLGTSFLNEITVAEKSLTPAQILDQLRDRVIKSLGQTGKEGENKDGMDISLARLNLKTFELQWAGANNPLYYFQGNELKEIKADKMPIAIHSKMDPFTNHTLQLKKGDSFYLFTDGYADQFGGPQGKKFRYKQFEQLLIENNADNFSSLKTILQGKHFGWKTNLEQTDDVCVIGMKI